MHYYLLQGNFDDCQSLVKAAFADTTFRSAVKLGAVNSINWARILVQIIYYFHCYYDVTEHIQEENQSNNININNNTTSTTTSNNTTATTTTNKMNNKKFIFAVPTGNFGDILAGFYAKQMGLPIEKLVICTNDNAILDNFMKNGEYKCNKVVSTIAPSMDISISSNFERYLYYLFDKNTSLLLESMLEFEKTGRIQVSIEQLHSAQEVFTSYSTTEMMILHTMRELFDTHNYLVCPHTATAVAAVHNILSSTTDNTPATTTTTTATNNTTATTDTTSTIKQNEPNNNQENNNIFVCLATAHPGKFQKAVTLALEESARPGRVLLALQPPNLPTELELLFNLPEKLSYLSNSLEAIQIYIQERI